MEKKLRTGKGCVTTKHFTILIFYNYFVLIRDRLLAHTVFAKDRIILNAFRMTTFMTTLKKKAIFKIFIIVFEKILKKNLKLWKKTSLSVSYFFKKWVISSKFKRNFTKTANILQ